jgi:hypothetical protein
LKGNLSVQLFDNKVRTDQASIKPNESIYTFLNRSARTEYAATRQLLETWFLDYPADPEQPRKSLRGRFRSKEEDVHIPAFFELYCHTLLKKQGFLVYPEQVVDETVGRPIDFLVQSPDTSHFYLEATVAMDVKTAPVSQRILRQLWNGLNNLQEPNFRIELHVKQESTQNLPINKMCSDIHDWLQELDPDEVSRWRETSAHDRWPFYKLDGWEIVFIAVPKPLASRGKPGNTVLGQFSLRWSKLQNSLQAALKEKEDRYGKFDLPYVIAVDVLAIDSLGCDIEEVLFGKEVFLFDKQSEEMTATRSPQLPDRPSEENGLWVGRGGSRNEHVSAILLVDELMPWSVARQKPILWHNPWAAKPLKPDIWQGPQKIFDPSSLQMQSREGKEVWEIMHLHQDWPHVSSETL